MECLKCHTPLPDNSRFCLSCGADVSGEGRERTLAVDGGHELMLALQSELGDEYTLERELGRGGMAIVFLGHDTRLGRKVAVKVLPPELTFGAGPQIIERFKREARTSATLDHPNIIPVYRVSPGGKLFWYVMKYLDGEPLDKLLQRDGQQPLDKTVEIVRQVSEGLDFAHHNQVVHRDIKPANVVIDTRGRVTVTDFGIAKALDSNALTGSGAMIGTPYYMSPEQCAGKRVGPASDQYSLAVMTYQMLGGHLPFTGESVVDIIRKHVMDPVPPLAVLRPSLPSAVVKVVERGLAKRAEERFASCAEFARALASAVEGREVAKAAPYTSGERMSKTAMASPIPGALRVAHATWSPARKAGIALGVVLALGAAAVGVWAYLGRPAPQAQAPRTVAAPVTQPAAALPQPADTAVPPPAYTTATPDTAAPPAAASRDGRLTLTGLPAGATILRDGRTVRGAVTGTVGRSYDIKVQAQGFQPWNFRWRPRGGTERRAVVMTPVTGSAPLAQSPPATSAPAPGTATPGGPPAAAQPQPSSQAAPGTASTPAAAAPSTARLTVTAVPTPASITVNGQRLGPAVRNREVPAGTVHLRFDGVDELGPWYDERIIEVTPGQNASLTRVPLQKRRP